MIEVERKFRLEEKNISHFVVELDRLSNSKRVLNQLDQVFLLKGDSFKIPNRSRPIMRIRSVNDVVKLTYKRSINDVGDSIEHELTIDSVSIAEALLTEIGYYLVVEIEKKRMEYVLPDATICLDEVKNLGSFLEIEILCPTEKDISLAQNKVMATAAQFGLTEADIETKKYDQLISLKQQGGSL